MSPARHLGVFVLFQDFERALKEKDNDRYVLRLYTTGMMPRSMRAVESIKAVCEEYLKGRYELEIVDIHQQPLLARGDQIIAAPALVKRLPEPLKRLVGDLSDSERILWGLDLRTVHEEHSVECRRRR
jgi:circadian clock protein KaiB